MNKENMTNKKQISKIKDVAQFISDNFYNGQYTIEKYSMTLYRFGFGIDNSNNIHGMFIGNSIEEAMYQAIDFELIKGQNIVSRKELLELVQKWKQKYEEGNIKYKDLVKKIDSIKQDQKHVIDVIDRFRNQWKDNTVMKKFEEKIEVWKDKKLSMFIAFLLEYIEKQAIHIDIVSSNINNSGKVEKKKNLNLKESKVLATFRTGKVFEHVWNEIRDTVIDGKWHTYSEVEDIIIKYSDHDLTTAAIQQKRQSYFYFVKDKKYYEVRGRKNYLFEWKHKEGTNIFRFTPIEEGYKETGSSIANINRYTIYDTVYNEFVELFCDGEYHTYTEAIKLFRKYDKYKKYKKRESFYSLIRAYMKYLNKSYHITKIRENRIYKFKFDEIYSKFDGESITLEKDTKCARCGQVIRCNTKCMLVGNMYYHLDCYDILNK